jgi:hypothetical protein
MPRGTVPFVAGECALGLEDAGLYRTLRTVVLSPRSTK